MRSFIISLSLFIILVAAIAFNYSYVNGCAEYLAKSAESLSFDTPDDTTLCEMEEYWDSHSDKIGLSVSYREIDHFCETMIELRSYYESGNRDEFEKSRALLIDAAEELARLEKFSIGNLL